MISKQCFECGNHHPMTETCGGESVEWVTDNDPLAFDCPRCGQRVAVTHVDGKTDIFHKKPLCASFESRDRDYAKEVFRLDEEARTRNDASLGDR